MDNKPQESFFDKLMNGTIRFIIAVAVALTPLGLHMAGVEWGFLGFILTLPAVIFLLGMFYTFFGVPLSTPEYK